MIGSRRYIGSSAFLNSARGGAASESASAQPDMFLEIIEREGPIDVATLSGFVNLAPNDVALQLCSLERLALVASQKCDHDVIYSLTETGKRARQLAFLAIA
jgi:hypothetical protein